MRRITFAILILLLGVSGRAIAQFENARDFQKICGLAGKEFKQNHSGKENRPATYLSRVASLASRDGGRQYLKDVVRTEQGSKCYLAQLILNRIANPKLAKQFDPFYQPDLVSWDFSKPFTRPQLKPVPLAMLSKDTRALAKKYPKAYAGYAALAKTAYKRLTSQGLSRTYHQWLRDEVIKLHKAAAASFGKQELPEDEMDVAEPGGLSFEGRQVLTAIAFATQIERHADTPALIPHHEYRFNVADQYRLFLCEAALFSRTPIIKGQFARLAALHDVDPYFFRLLAIQYLNMGPGDGGEPRIGQHRFIGWTMNAMYLHPNMENLRTLAEIVSRTRGSSAVGSEFKPIPHYERPGEPSAKLREEWRQLLKQVEGNEKMKCTYNILSQVKKQIWVFSGKSNSDLPR